MHLHQVVLDWRPADDDAHSHRYLVQPLHQLRLRVLDFVTLQKQGMLQEFVCAGNCLMTLTFVCKQAGLTAIVNSYKLHHWGSKAVYELTSSRIIKSHEGLS